jgi:hypothetical protein
MLLGPNGKKNRQKVTKFAKNVKKEVAEKSKDVKKLAGVIKKATLSMEKQGVRKVAQAKKVVKKVTV